MFLVFSEGINKFYNSISLFCNQISKNFNLKIIVLLMKNSEIKLMIETKSQNILYTYSSLNDTNDLHTIIL